MNLRVLALVVAAQLVTAGPLGAQALFTDTTLQGEFWMPFQPLLPGELETRVPDEAKLDALLEDVVRTFSGMAYGWSFRYRPAVRDRGVAEVFEVTPLGRILGTTGDPATARALVTASRLEPADDTLRIEVRYYLTPAEAQRRRAWGSVGLDVARGVGRAEAVDRLESRAAALDQALKAAVRSLIERRAANEPLEVTGEALLREVPRTGIDAGRYVTQAAFQVRLLSVRPYQAY